MEDVAITRIAAATANYKLVPGRINAKDMKNMQATYSTLLTSHSFMLDPLNWFKQSLSIQCTAFSKCGACSYTP